MEDYADIYESNRMELVRNLRVQRTFLFDYLRSKKILDKADCELIEAEVTSERKAGKLLDLLELKGKNGYTCFTEALQLQSPDLYEMLTGKVADLTHPILKRYQDSRKGREGGMEEVEIELLTEHLSSLYADLQRTTSQYNNIVKEKRKLEEELKTNEVQLERQRSQLMSWEEKFQQEKCCSLKKQTRAEKSMYTMTFEIELAGETIKILEGDIGVLKMELLQANEEIYELKTHLSNANTKKDREMRFRQEIGESYEKERKQAARLSLKIKNQEDQLQVLEYYKRRCGELEFSNTEVNEEKEKLQKELKELAKWTKGLKDRFDLIESENTRTHESNWNVAQNIKALQDETRTLKQKSSYLEIKNDFLTFRTTCLEKDCEMYKQQRNNAMASRNEAAEERDKVWKERELGWHNYIEIQKARDSEIEKRESCMKQLDEKEAKFNEVFSELTKTKLKLNKAKFMIEECEREINDTRETEGTNDSDKSPVTCEPRKTTFSEECVDADRFHSQQKLIRSLKRRVDRHCEENYNGATAASRNRSLSNRMPSFDFLMDMIWDFSDDDNNIEESLSYDSSIKKWASCSQLDDIPQMVDNTMDFPVDIARHSLAAMSLPNLHSLDNPENIAASGREETQGAEDELTSHSHSRTNILLTTDVRKFLLEVQFRRRTNDMISRPNLPMMKRRNNGMSKEREK